MKNRINLSLLLLLSFTMVNLASATTITYETSDLGGGAWEYTYSITNDSLAVDIEEVSIYFDYGIYENLAVTTPMSDWDELLVEPELVWGWAEDGYYDAMALSSGIASGETVTAFTVNFDWLGGGTPGAQYFEILDPMTWDLIDDGMTTAAPPVVAAVPEPETAFLLLVGLTGLFCSRRRSQSS